MENRMVKRKITGIFSIAAAGILAVLAFIALLLAQARAREKSAGPIVMSVADTPEPVLVEMPAASPELVAADALPLTARTLLVNGTPVLTLSSEEELKAVLNTYLALCAVAPEGERFVSAEFADELILVRAMDGLALTGYGDALAMLAGKPGMVAVRVVTEIVTVSEVPVEKPIITSDGALAKGCRIITQYSVTGRVETVTRRIYIAGELAEEGEPFEARRRESRVMLVRRGTWSGKSDTPGRNEGLHGKSAGSLRLSLPMRGNITFYFGMRHGSMHSGIDIEANAGTTVVAPGEGVVVFRGPRGEYGFVVDIDHGNGFLSRLTHLDADSVQVDYHQRVFPGDKIGTLAAVSAGKPHLHYELIIDAVPYNPLFYVQ